jgi:V8-like Glu-specific endopeptidase
MKNLIHRFIFIFVFIFCLLPSAGQAVILDELEWDDVSQYPFVHPIRQKAMAVGNMWIPLYKARCTGFLIGPKTVMTNHHCVSSRYHAWEIEMTFSFISGVGKGIPSTYKCNKFIGANKKLDYALLNCEDGPGLVFGYMELANEEALEGDEVYIPQQNCDYKTEKDCSRTQKVSFGHIEKVDRRLHHNADTLGGSSGAPVLSTRSHHVVGLHYAGVEDEQNYAKKMNKIKIDIQKKYPQILFREISKGPIVPKNHYSQKRAWLLESVPASFPFVPFAESDKKHFYQFQKKTGTAFVQVFEPKEKKVRSIKLYNKHGGIVGFGDSSRVLKRIKDRGNRDKSISLTGLKGEYWIEVELKDKTSGDYSLSVTY